MEFTCLPHAGGGVSIWTSMSMTPPLSSPRGWGCFYTELPVGKRMTVFPTRVGVFLHSRGGRLR